MRTFLLSLGGLLLLLASACGEGSAPLATPPSREEQQRAAFRQLNASLLRIDEQLAQLNDAALKAQAQASADALKKRRDALRADFSLAAYEELQLDVALDLRRLAAWVTEEVEAAGVHRKKRAP